MGKAWSRFQQQRVHLIFNVVIKRKKVKVKFERWYHYENDPVLTCWGPWMSWDWRTVDWAALCILFPYLTGILLLHFNTHSLTEEPLAAVHTSSDLYSKWLIDLLYSLSLPIAICSLTLIHWWLQIYPLYANEMLIIFSRKQRSLMLECYKNDNLQSVL